MFTPYTDRAWGGVNSFIIALSAERPCRHINCCREIATVWKATLVRQAAITISVTLATKG